MDKHRNVRSKIESVSKDISAMDPSYAGVRWRGMRQNIPFLIVSTQATGACRIGREWVRLAGTAMPNMPLCRSTHNDPEHVLQENQITLSKSSGDMKNVEATKQERVFK